MITTPLRRSLGRQMLPILVCAIAAWPAFAAEPISQPAAPKSAAPAKGAAAAAWEALKSQSIRPTPPEGWKQKKPAPEEIKAWKDTESTRLVKLGASAQDFLKKFPSDAMTAEASQIERQAFLVAARLGNAEAEKRIDELDAIALADAKTTSEERFKIRADQVTRTALAKYAATDNMAAAMDTLESGARKLIEEFPGRGEPYGMLMEVASGAPVEKGRALAEEILKSNALDEIKAAATGLLKKLDAIGKPVDIQFTAVDGRAVDVQKMKGKVVLIDFWATWCGPCVAEIPNVLEAYGKLHGKGFEIVGLSFDQEKASLESFVAEKKMPWPQFFDASGGENKFGQQFGIQQIPTMWLIDKKGLLREENARDGLEEKIEKLLAEK